MMRWALALPLLAALVAGCATAPVRDNGPDPRNPVEILEWLRARCLQRGMVWLETSSQWSCETPANSNMPGDDRPPTDPENKERT